MTKDQLSGRSWLRAIGIGLGVAVLTALVAVILTAIGVSPFPKPPSLAFAETLLGRDLPLPVGLLFHTAYVTFWCVVFVLFFSAAQSQDGTGSRISTVAGYPGGFLSDGGLGICGTEYQSQADSGLPAAARVFRDSLVGLG